jgi:PAS domain S-box-containing protein
MSDLDVVPSAVLDAIMEGMILADSAGAILLVNREAQDLLGLKAGELIGQPLETLIAERHNITHAVELRGYLDSAAGQLIRRRHRPSRDTWRGRPMRNRRGARAAAGDHHMLVVSIRDLVAQRQAEQTRLYGQRLKSLHAIGQAIRAARAPDIAAQTALRHIRRLVPCTQAVVLAFDLDAAEAVALAASPDGVAGARRPLGAIDIADVLRRGRPYLVGDSDGLSQLPSSALVFMPAGACSFMRAPLVAGGRLIGSIDVAASAPNAFDQHQVAIICEVADQLAIALQNNQLLEQVRANSERLRALSRQLMEIQENERRHIARELHDEIGQSLTAVKINLETILRLPNTNAIEPHLAESIAIVERVLQQVRAISLDLRPSMLDDLGLESALRWYLGRQAERAGLTSEFTADSIDAAQLPPEVRTACFRVVQEALTNVVRHAHARHVRVELRRRGATLRLHISDDGIGFDPHEAQARAAHGASLGLVGMQERALIAGGELIIEAAPGRGTTIRAHFPLSAAAVDCSASRTE